MLRSFDTHIPVVLLAPAADARMIENAFQRVFPERYRVLATYADMSLRTVMEDVLSSSIQLVIVHQGVENFTTEGLQQLVFAPGKSARVVAALVQPLGDVFDAALHTQAVPYHLPFEDAILQQIDASFPTLLSEASQRMAGSVDMPEAVPSVESPEHFQYMPGMIRQALQIFTLWGTKGGVGKSTIAMELARILSDIGGRKVLCVDADVSRGYIAPRLGEEAEAFMEMNRNIVNLATMFQRNNQTLPRVADFLYNVPPLAGKGRSNLDILFGLKEIEQGQYECFRGSKGEAGISFIKALNDYALRQGYEFLIYDIGTEIPNPLHYGALLSATTLIVVSTPLYPSIKPTLKGVNVIEGKGVKTRSAMRLVINEWTDGLDYDKIEFARFLGVPLLAALPYVSKGVLNPIVNHGRFILDAFLEMKDAPDDLKALVTGYLSIAEQFSPGIMSAGRQKYPRLKKSITAQRRGLFGRKE
jgi:MinD-like ATPase involved in chromosome partitioning or flagellar assembly